MRFLFVGGRRGLEADLVRAADLPFHATPMPSLRDPDSRLSLITRAVLFPLAFIDALVRVVRFGASICFSTGGLVSFPIVLAARAAGVPVYIWTGDVIPGRANRALARFAGRVGAAFPGTERFLPAGKVVVSGNPIRRSLLRWRRDPVRAQLDLRDGDAVVLVTGGSQGAERINEAVLSALPQLLRRCIVIHHTGAAHIGRAEARRSSLSAELRDRYRPFGFSTDEIGAALAAADLVVGRASSSSIAEPLAFGVPLVLIPFGAAMSGHQAANARSVVERGAAVLLPEAELSAERLTAVVLGLLDDPPRHERMRAAARAAGRPEAALEIARDLLRLGRCAA